MKPKNQLTRPSVPPGRQGMSASSVHHPTNATPSRNPISWPPSVADRGGQYYICSFLDNICSLGVMKSRELVLLDAAIEVLAERGTRGLTHRAVDARAGLPLGSTSNRFRTRNALLGG